MLAALDEQVVQQLADRLGGIAVPLVLGGKGGADLGLAWIVGLDVGRAVADEPIGSAQATANWNLGRACRVDGRSSCRNWRAWLGR